LYFELPEGDTPGGSTLAFVAESLESKEKFPFEIVLPADTFGSGLAAESAQEIAFNPQEPWTGIWRVEGSRLIGGIWAMKQNGRIVKSTDDSYYKFEGKVRGNQLEGKIVGDYDIIRRFVVTMSSDGLTFDGNSRSHHLSGKRQKYEVLKPNQTNR
jgi:hypothetical protein